MKRLTCISRLSKHCLLAVCLWLFACAAPGQELHQAGAISATPRIIAIGDIHGDYDQFVKLLRAVGVINSKDKWVAGGTQLVQLGDIPDRGPDSRKAMDLLMKLQKSAAKAGGAVQVLIGNHEAMMMSGDLRYVHAGEFAAFKDSKSRARRKAYYQQTVAHIKSTTPEEEWPEFDKAYRKAWEARFPLGYVEHRMAWAPSGKYGKWVLSNSAVLKLGDTLFVHGGVSPEQSAMPISEINTRVRTALARGEQLPADTIVESQTGPLWNRSWVNKLQTSANEEILNQVLASYSVKRMVVAHTPVAPVIVPRFNGKVLLADVGLGAHYGHGFAALEIVGDEAYTLVGARRVKLPNNNAEFDAYFDTVQSLVSNPQKLIRYRELVAQAEAAAGTADNADADSAPKSVPTQQQ